jgi:hypothetical protein
MVLNGDSYLFFKSIINLYPNEPYDVLTDLIQGDVKA